MADTYTTYSSQVPGGSRQGEQMAAVHNAWMNSMKIIGQKRGNFMRQAGYMVDNDGNPILDAAGNYQVDGTNQYSTYQRMHQKHALDLDSLKESQGARGFAGAGFLQNQEGNLRFDQGTDAADFGSNFLGGLTGFNQEANEADANANMSYGNIVADAARDAIFKEQFNQGDHSAVPEPGYGPGGTTPAPPGGPVSTTGAPVAPGALTTAQADPWMYSVPGLVQAPAPAPAPVSAPDPWMASATSSTPTPGKIMWGGQSLNKAGMISWLKAHGENVNQWVANHPAAAKTLGF